MVNALLKNLTDLELIANFRDLNSEARENLVHQLEYLSELDRRKLNFHYPSLRSFCVAELGMEEWESDRKIRAARALQRFPELKCKFESGQMNLTLLELALGVAHREKLSDANLEEVFSVISGKSCQAAEREIATLYPQSHKLPKDRIRPLTEDLSMVQFVASRDLLEKLEEIRGLLASSNPKLSLADVFDVLATEYYDRHHPEARAKRAKERGNRRAARLKEKVTAEKVTEEKQSIDLPVEAKTVRSEAGPGSKSTTDLSEEFAVPKSIDSNRRTLPRALFYDLITRDGYRCSYEDPISQTRCNSQYRLEVDHRVPWSKAGETTLENCRLLCIRHHRRVSFLEFGETSLYANKPC